LPAQPRGRRRQILDRGAGRRRAEDGAGVLEASVLSERHVHEAEQGEQPHHAFHEPATNVAEHGAIVAARSK
jgi:hypothetical protein